MSDNVKKKKKKRHPIIWTFLYLQIFLILAVLGVLAYYYFSGYAAKVTEMHREAVDFVRQSTPDTFRRDQTSEAYDTDGKLISVLKGEVDSYYLTYDEIPLDAIHAIVSIEDKQYYHHPGYDLKAIMRAAYVLFKEKKITQGGSTITQQLARTIFLTNDRTWERKVEEIYIAVELEKKYTKRDILEYYLNNIYFGNGYYGLEAAAQGYFHKSAGELSTSQLAFLCGLPNNPTLYNPRKELSAAVGRRDRILRNMFDDGILTAEAYMDAVSEKIKIKKPKTVHNNYMESFLFYCATRALMEANGFEFRTEFVDEEDEEAYRKAYDEAYDEWNAKLFSGGYRIYTTLDQKIQKKLRDSIDNGLKGFKEKSKEGIYKLQGSGVCIDNDTGCVRAIVGGRTQKLTGYTLNRAFQSFRQPGSSIKPLVVYTPALENGYTPNTIVEDAPIEDGPKNADGAYSGRITLRTAVEKSKNTVAWRIFDKLTPEVGLSYLKAMDFRGIVPTDYRNAASLGGLTKGVSALEMAKGYATIENDGGYREPTCIFRITDSKDELIYENAGISTVIYETNASREMTDVLTGVFKNGTAKGLALDNDMPCAGKTGTTNDYKDGWFAGYTRYYTTAIWVGYDMPQRLNGLTGSSYPGRIWKDFMNKIHKGKEKLDFIKPVKVKKKKEKEIDASEIERELEEQQNPQIDVELTPEEEEPPAEEEQVEEEIEDTPLPPEEEEPPEEETIEEEEIEVIDDEDVSDEDEGELVMDDEEPPLPPEDEADDPGDDI
ncbi:MAG: PBP1A family penicillin-binding protein [Lachnospiraceae bacterium]|nr:PBP1A family penicillin-binding protein [Lachnospiraceae bacterium]